MKQVTHIPRHTQSIAIVLAHYLWISAIKRASNAHMHLQSQMCKLVIAQAFSSHLLVVNREMAHLYSVQCTQCIHRNAVYVMLQNSDNVYASRDHSDILHNVLYCVYCVMYYIGNALYTLLYVLAHKCLFTDLYSVLYLLILFVDPATLLRCCLLGQASSIFHTHFS